MYSLLLSLHFFLFALCAFLRNEELRRAHQMSIYICIEYNVQCKTNIKQIKQIKQMAAHRGVEAWNKQSLLYESTAAKAARLRDWAQQSHPMGFLLICLNEA